MPANEEPEYFFMAGLTDRPRSLFFLKKVAIGEKRIVLSFSVKAIRGLN